MLFKRGRLEAAYPETGPVDRPGLHRPLAQTSLPGLCSLWLLTTAWLPLIWPLIGHTWAEAMRGPGWGWSFLTLTPNPNPNPNPAVPHHASAALWGMDQESGHHNIDWHILMQMTIGLFTISAIQLGDGVFRVPWLQHLYIYIYIYI